jgi:hypothetical protein
MHANLPLGLILLLLLASCAASAPLRQDADARSQPPAELLDDRELIVLTAPPADPMIAQAEALGYALSAIHPLPQLDDDLVAFRIPPGRTIPEAIDEIEAASPGVTAGAHHLYRLQTVTGTGADRFYANALIGWPPGGCPAYHSVGMIDAGLPPTHPALADGSIVEQRFFDGDEVPATDHGALMASLLVGPGRLTDTTLYSANVIDPTLSGGDATGVVAILRAVDWLSAQGVDLVNVSLAGPRNKLLDRGLGHAAANAMILVAAAGNAGPTAPPQYPAAFPFVLAVTAVDRALDVYERAVRGAQIDVAAPGVDILLEDAGRLRVLSGTSAAVPFVTAAIAADPGLNDLRVTAIRERLAAHALDLGAAGRDPVFGAGLILSPEPCSAD